MAESFKEKKTFEIISYTLPEWEDPLGFEVKPLTITNLEEFGFITLLQEINEIRVDPNKIP